MSRPVSIFEAAAAAGDMSIEEFAETDAYTAGVADGSIVEWVRTGPSHGDASGDTADATTDDAEEAEPAPKAKRTKSA